jgi:hypothetical protein
MCTQTYSVGSRSEGVDHRNGVPGTNSTVGMDEIRVMTSCLKSPQRLKGGLLGIGNEPAASGSLANGDQE